MLGVIRGENRFCTQTDWLTSYHLFSFDTYYDPQNISFGHLRVFNDDLLRAGTGFAPHPHREMEILTIVLAGTLVHEDSLGNQTKLRRGEIQCMSAGSGIVHSEFASREADAHFLQLWFLPEQNNLPATYTKKSFSSNIDSPGLTCLISCDQTPESLLLNSPARVFWGYLPAGESLLHNTNINQGIFLYLLQGCLIIPNTVLHQYDHLRFVGDGQPLRLTAGENSYFILIDILRLS